MPKFPGTILKQPVLKVRKEGEALRLVFLARAILAATLLLAILSASVSFTVVAGGPFCTLACCAGRQTHEAGSCMTGSCHSGLIARARTKTRHTRQPPTQEFEQLCGLLRSATKTSGLPVWEAATIHSGTDAHHEHFGSSRVPAEPPKAAGVSARTMAKPCAPDCGSCASGVTTQKRQRNPATLAYAARPRPPSSIRVADVEDGLTRLLGALCRQCAPRGPPVAFS